MVVSTPAVCPSPAAALVACAPTHTSDTDNAHAPTADVNPASTDARPPITHHTPRGDAVHVDVRPGVWRGWYTCQGLQHWTLYITTVLPDNDGWIDFAGVVAFTHQACRYFGIHR